MNAIIIDDHPLARIAIRNLLDSNGITVAAELDSGAHAVQTAESMQPDLLIVDVDIPELSGIEVLEQLRKRRYQRKGEIAVAIIGCVDCGEDIIHSLFFTHKTICSAVGAAFAVEQFILSGNDDDCSLVAASTTPPSAAK